MPSHTRESNLHLQHTGADTRPPLCACSCIDCTNTERVCTENWPWREKCLVAPGSRACVHRVPDWTLNHLRYIPAPNKFQAQSFMWSPSKQHGHVYQPWQVLRGEFGAVNHLVSDGFICFLVGGAGTYCLVPWHLPPKWPWTTEMMTFMFLVKADSKYTHKHWCWGFHNIQIQQFTQKDHGYHRYMYLRRNVFTRALYFKTAWRVVHLICIQCFLPGMTHNLYFYKEYSASGSQRNKIKTIHRHNKVTLYLQGCA